MAESIGSVRFILAASTAVLERDLDKAKSLTTAYTRKLQKDFDNGRKVVNKYGNSILAVGTTGAAGFAALAQKSIEFADRTAKTADKVGVSTDALQEYRFAANQSGVATNTLDMGLQRFSRRLGEAAQGSGELLGVLEENNIQVRDSTGNMRANEDVLNDLANAISGAESEQEALRIAFKAFDSEGAAMVNMLRGGSSGLDEMRGRARELGLVLDEDLLRNAEKANDQLDILGKVVSVNISNALLQLSPLIQATAEELRKSLTDSVDEAGNTTDDFANKAIDGFRTITTALGVFLDGLHGMHLLLKGGEVAFEGLRGAAKLYFEYLNRLMIIWQKNFNLHMWPLKKLGEFIGEDWDFTINVNTKTDFDKILAESSEKIKKVQSEFDKLMAEELPSEGLKRSVQSIIDRVKVLQEEAKKAKKETDDVVEGGGRVGRGAGRGDGAGGGANAIIKARNKAMNEYTRSLISDQREAELLFEKEEKLDELFTKGKIGVDIYNEELDKLADTIKDIGTIGDSTFEALKDAIKGWGASFASELNEMLWESDRTFGDILASFTKMLTQLIIQKAIVEPFIETILPPTKSAKGNVFSGGSVMPFARGGVVTRPTLFPMAKGTGLMGEAGPEGILPLKRLPGGNLGVQADMSGGGVNVTVVNQTGVEADANVSQSNDGSVEVLLTRAVASNIARGGEIAKGIESTYGLRRKGVRR